MEQSKNIMSTVESDKDNNLTDKATNENENTGFIQKCEKTKSDGDKRSRTNPRQIKLIEIFYKTYHEELMSKDTFDKLWVDLSNQLNDLGPPTRTLQEWKRVRSDQKYNQKRKRSSYFQEPERNTKL